MILMFVRSCIDWIQDTFHWVLLKLKDTLAKIALTVFVLVVLLWLSIFMYGVFYFAYVPPASYVKPIHLEFSVCENGIGMCSFPTANISLLRQGQDEVFMKGQSYKILFDIEIPESPTNKELGMFMITLQLYNSKGGIVKTSSRSVSAILHYRSELLRILDTFTFAPLLLFGYSEQKQLISTEFFSNYLDDAYNPAVGAVIQVQSMKIELYNSILRIYATFSGIRYFMFHWPVLSSVVGIGMNMAFLSFIALLSWYQCMGTNKKDDTEPSWSDRGSPNLEERRQNVRQMLERERQRGAEYSEDKSRQLSSPDDDVVTETIGGTTGGPEDEGGEETVIYKSMPECDTELRLRHSITVKQS